MISLIAKAFDFELPDFDCSVNCFLRPLILFNYVLITIIIDNYRLSSEFQFVCLFRPSNAKLQTSSPTRSALLLVGKALCC